MGQYISKICGNVQINFKMMKTSTSDIFILGVNAYHGDSSACILKNGELVAGIEEERLRRIKHWAGFPTESIKYCLTEAGIGADRIDHLTFSRDPMAQLHRKIWHIAKKRPSPHFILDRLNNMAKIKASKKELGTLLQGSESIITARVHNIEHHRSHSASAFFVSPYEHAAVVSVDAFGDFRSTLISTGQGNELKPISSVNFPHSLGLMYTAVTQYLGFPYYGDEYKVMGLASYGKPTYIDEFRKIVMPQHKGQFKLNLKYFLHSTKGVQMRWENCAPEVDKAYSDYMERRLGPARKPTEIITQKHKDIAASLQKRLEEIYFHILNYAYTITKDRNLALAGGVAFNSVANGKIYDSTEFENIYIQSAAGDAGTALGSAIYVHNNTLKKPRQFVMNSSYWGPSYDSTTLAKTLDNYGLSYKSLEEDELIDYTAKAIKTGKIVGWFQGRAEWGPRALGNRSILCDPRQQDMREILNSRIKRRENFRPFAPSILVEATADYFETSHPDPFMMKVYPIKKDKQDDIPSVTHVDGTGRLQTVSKEDNPRYWKLINRFGELTGVPILLNTSFNENEPMVCSPEEAIDCFLRARMDLLVLGNHIVYESSSENINLKTSDNIERDI